jgi:hypothetical protein
MKPAPAAMMEPINGMTITVRPCCLARDAESHECYTLHSAKTSTIAIVMSASDTDSATMIHGGTHGSGIRPVTISALLLSLTRGCRVH